MKLHDIPTKELRRLIRAAEYEQGPASRTAAILRREIERRNAAAKPQRKAVARGK